MKKKIRWKPLGIAVILVTISLLTYIGTIRVDFLEIMELKTIDFRFKFRGPIPANSEVVLAVIDEKSINKEGKWVWPRSRIADLVKKLSKAGVAVIAFDIGFLETDNYNLVICKTIEKIKSELVNLDISNDKITGYLEELRLRTDHDRLLADAIKNSEARVVLGYFFHLGEEETEHLEEKDVPYHQDNILGSRHNYVRYENEMAMDAFSFKDKEAVYPQTNIKVLAESTEYSGFFNMVPDNDGVVRRIPSVLKFREDLYAPLSLMTLSAYLDEVVSLSVDESGIDEIQIGGQFIPVDDRGDLIINYHGEQKTYPHISVTDILHDKIPADKLRDKIVFVGATAKAIYDMRVTPLGSVYPGLEVHANIVDSVLTNDFLIRSVDLLLADILAIMITGLILGIILPRLGALTGAIFSSALFFGYIYLCHFVFSSYGLIINMIYPLSTILMVYLGITVYKYIVESRQKNFIKSAFSTYLAPSVVNFLIDSPEKLELGGEERIITAFFSDVQSFTSISEKLGPKELVELLNEFLTEMTNIILKHQGTVDKFEGDAIIAFFGAPLDLDNQAESACLASIEMQIRLAELRKEWEQRDMPALKMRIGLCTGPAVVGNMGSKNRMDYTMMGDTVNTAARLEGVNKIYGTYSLVGETSREMVGDKLVTRELDSIYVVGKHEPLPLYELLGIKGSIDAKMMGTIAHYENGLQAYRNQEWETAIDCFDKGLESLPDDGPCLTMRKRSEEFKVDPPGEDWDGSYHMQTK